MAKTRYIRKEADGSWQGHAALSDNTVGRIFLERNADYDPQAEGATPYGTLSFHKYLKDGKHTAKDGETVNVTRLTAASGTKYLQSQYIPMDGMNYQFTMFHSPADARRKLPECYTFVIDSTEQDENFVETNEMSL